MSPYRVVEMNNGTYKIQCHYFMGIYYDWVPHIGSNYFETKEEAIEKMKSLGIKKVVAYGKGK